MPRYLLEIDTGEVVGVAGGRTLRRIFDARDDHEARQQVERRVILTRLTGVRAESWRAAEHGHGGEVPVA